MLGILETRTLFRATLTAAAGLVVACGGGTPGGAATTTAPVAVAQASTAAATDTPAPSAAPTVAPTLVPTAAPTMRPAPSPTSRPVATARPTPIPTSMVPVTPRPTAPPAATPVIMAAASAGQGTILVAASDRMTLYTFGSDVAGSGTSGCTGGCNSTWPALTVPAGTTPADGPGATGRIGTIPHGAGTLQVTYNGLPLYLYANDRAPGDTNGNYPGWSLARP